jgi:hypothetical protein
MHTRLPADAMSEFLFLARIENLGSLTHGPRRRAQTARSALRLFTGFSNLGVFQI